MVSMDIDIELVDGRIVEVYFVEFGVCWEVIREEVMGLLWEEGRRDRER